MNNEYVKNYVLPNINFHLEDSHLQEHDEGRKQLSKYLIGEIFTSIRVYDFKIIKAYKGNSYRQIEFLETGYRKIVESKCMNTLCIVDPYEPSVCNVGIIGELYNQPQYSKNTLYTRWVGMIRRCYDEDCKSFKDYGAKGCIVSDDWLYYPKYINDIKKKDHYFDLITDTENWHIDKDILSSSNNKIYSNETTCIITKSNNIKERNDRNGNPSKYKERKVAQYTMDDNFIQQFDTIKDAAIYIKNDIRYLSHISKVCSGKGKSAFGYKWRYVS